MNPLMYPCPEPALQGLAIGCLEDHPDETRCPRAGRPGRSRQRKKPPPIQIRRVLFRQSLIADRGFLGGMILLWLGITLLSTLLLLLF